MASESTDQQESIEERATAFVFGEMDREEATEFMKSMDASPSLRSLVASIRDAVSALQTEFEGDTLGVHPGDRRKIELAIHPSQTQAPPVVMQAPDAMSRRWATGLAIAATLLLVCGLTLPAMNRIITVNLDTKDLQQKLREIESQNRRLSAEKRALKQQLASARSALPTIANDPTIGSGRPESTPPENALPESSLADAIGHRTNDGESAGEFRVPAADALEGNSSTSGPPTSGPLGPPGPSDDEAMIASTTGPSANARPEALPVNDSHSEPDLELADGSRDRQNRDRQNSGSSEPETKRTAGQAAEKAVAGHTPDGPTIESMADQQRRAGTQNLLGQAFPTRPTRANRQSQAGRFADSRKRKELVADSKLIGGKGAASLDRLNRRAGERQDLDLQDLGAAFTPEQDLAIQLHDGDSFTPIRDNDFLAVPRSPLSTFSIDVDPAAFARVRMDLTQGRRLPDPGEVRIEELINFFDYNYAPPDDDHPFAASLAIAPCPWNPKHRLARIGIKGRVVKEDRPPSNLVFLIDVSGSMNRPNRLPVVLDGVQTLIKQLDERDTVSLVVYAGAEGLVLETTQGDRKKTITDALQRLKEGGPTDGGQGIQLAYRIARDHFLVGGTNRVILCSDGDLKVGATETTPLVKLAEDNAKDNVFLTVLGFGTDSRNDATLQRISKAGNSHYAFVDTNDEARKVLVDQIQGTLLTIAKDVSTQVEFNPKEVEAYRLIGFENRVLPAQDIIDDSEDAVEIEAGHTVTALYELVPKRASKAGDQRLDSQPIDALKYQRPIRLSKEATSGELLTLKLRYTLPTSDESQVIEFSVKDRGEAFELADNDFQFAASVAAFGMILRDSPHKGNSNFEMVEGMATAGAVDDRTGYRDEFLSLVRLAREIAGE